MDDLSFRGHYQLDGETFSEMLNRISKGFKSRPAKQKTLRQIFESSNEWKGLRAKFMRDNTQVCVKCGATDHLNVDHIKPKSKYRHLALEWSNLQILCWSCNKAKAAHD